MSDKIRLLEKLLGLEAECLNCIHYHDCEFVKKCHATDCPANGMACKDCELIEEYDIINFVYCNKWEFGND